MNIRVLRVSKFLVIITVFREVLLTYANHKHEFNEMITEQFIQRVLWL